MVQYRCSGCGKLITRTNKDSEGGKDVIHQYCASVNKKVKIIKIPKGK